MRKEAELESGGFGTRCREKEQAQAKNVPTKPRDSATPRLCTAPVASRSCWKAAHGASTGAFSTHSPCSAGAPPRGEHPGHPISRPGTPHPGEQPGHPTSRIPRGAPQAPHIPEEPTSRSDTPHPAQTLHMLGGASWTPHTPGEAPRAPQSPGSSRDTPHPTREGATRAPQIPGTPRSIPGTPHAGHPTSRGEPPGRPTSRPAMSGWGRPRPL